MATKSKDYWYRRIEKQMTALADKSADEMDGQLRREYRRVYNDLWRYLVSLYSDIMTGDEDVLINTLYQYNRNYEMMSEINKKLKALGETNIALLDEKLTGCYDYCKENTADAIGHLATGAEMEAIHEIYQVPDADKKVWSKAIWCRDGKNAADRVSDNMAKLSKTVQSGVIDCISRGASKDELTKTLMKRFSVSYNEASRLSRTELLHTTNKAKLDAYNNTGVKKYKFVAADDCRTCDICKGLDGKVFPLSAAVEGENYPVMHPNDRCTTIPVVEF